MKLAKRQNYLKDVELDQIFLEILVLTEQLVKLGTLQKRHDEEQVKVCLERVIHRADEWMSDLKQDLLLDERTLDYITLNKLVLANSFDCVEIILVSQFCKVNAPKRTLTDLATDLETL